MITGEIRVNEVLMLLRWDASRIYDDDETKTYEVNLDGIDGGHHPFHRNFLVSVPRGSRYPVLMCEILKYVDEMQSL